MNAKQERTQVVEGILRSGCKNYLYEYLFQRKEQASFTKDIQLEHDGYLAKLHNFKNDRVLGESAKIALDAFTMEKMTLDVTSFWNEVKKLEEEETAVRTASLGHLNIFGKTLTHYAQNGQKRRNLSLNENRKPDSPVSKKIKATNISSNEAEGSSRSKNTSPSSSSQSSEIAGFSRGTQIKTTKGPSASASSDSESQCLDIEEADEQISSADENETIEIKYDDLEELEQQITFSSLNEWEVGTVNVSRKFKEYQRQLIASVRQKETKLTWNNTFELLALSSIIVMCWPCPYSTFTSSEWRQVLNSNPHKITQPILTDSLLTTFYKATNDFSLGLNYSFPLNNDSELDEKAYRIFNYIKDELPLSSKRKETENKHNVYYLDPFIKIIFGGEYTPYTLELNKSVNGKQRPDFNCVVDDIAILNSEIKPSGYTKLRKNQDFVKVHLKGKKSINKLLEMGGPNKSTAFLNTGDIIESYCIDLAYDGVYRSWPCLKNKLATDKGSFPLIVLTFSHFVMMERHVSEIINDYENRPPPGSYTPTEQIEKMKFIRKMPTTPQLNSLLKQ